MKFSNIIGMIIVCLLIIAVGAGMYFVMNDSQVLSEQDVSVKNEIVENETEIKNEIDNTTLNTTNDEVENEIVENEVKDTEVNDVEEDVETTEPIEPTNPVEQEVVENAIVEKEYISGYEVAGYISIPKFNVNGPIFSAVTKATLELSAGVALGNLNEIGHTVLMGHAYQGYPFENISKLENGDTVIVTDANKREITYEVIDKQVVNSNDATYMIRQANASREITMQTGHSDTTRLIVILREKN